MPYIHFLPDNKKVDARKNEDIRNAALRSGIPLTNICKGKGRCSTCRILVIAGLEHCSPRSSKEEDIAKQLSFSPKIRLACQTSLTGNLEVRRLIVDEHDIELTSRLITDEEANLTGVEKHVFIMFADIREFTAFSEFQLPYDVIHILNRFFYLMNEIIKRYGGYIDNYMGDGLMALFEVENPDEGAFSAVKAGLEMLDIQKKKIQPYTENLFGKSFEIGIGLHYGLVVAGTVGGSSNKKTTVIGAAVNFASRIESSNKLMNTKFLISQDVFSKVSDRIQINHTLHIEMPGKTGVKTLYEVTSLR
ncbi:MAG: adenylate/guanylate cyclase domain-containing protein [Thermodesulfovibrionia bacterium]